MQKLEQSVVIFCMACLCAELLALLVGEGWAQRCIKAAAGLYILIVFAGTLPGAWAVWKEFVPQPVQPTALGTWDEMVRVQAERQLGQALEERLQEQLGLEARAEVVLEESTEGTVAASARIVLPGNCSEVLCRCVTELVQAELGLAEENVAIDCIQEEEHS